MASQSKEKTGNKHKGKRVARNKATKKYIIQRMRTERNRIKRNSRAWQRRKFKVRS